MLICSCLHLCPFYIVLVVLISICNVCSIAACSHVVGKAMARSGMVRNSMVRVYVYVCLFACLSVELFVYVAYVDEYVQAGRQTDETGN